MGGLSKSRSDRTVGVFDGYDPPLPPPVVVVEAIRTAGETLTAIRPPSPAMPLHVRDSSEPGA